MFHPLAIGAHLADFARDIAPDQVSRTALSIVHAACSAGLAIQSVLGAAASVNRAAHDTQDLKQALANKKTKDAQAA